MGETAGVAVLALLALTLPLHGADPPGHLGTLILLATVIGTVVARRRAEQGPLVERLLRRSAVATLVASVVLLVLLSVTGQ